MVVSLSWVPGENRGLSDSSKASGGFEEIGFRTVSLSLLLTVFSAPKPVFGFRAHQITMATLAHAYLTVMQANDLAHDL
jgi:hypothetical protein